jgi:hypothetical protein
MFSAEAQFNSVTGTQNRLALDKFNADFERREAVRGRLDQKRDTLFAVLADHTLLTSQLAQTQAQGTLTGEREVERQQTIRDLQAQIAVRAAQKTALETEVAALKEEATALNTAVAAPTLTSALPAGTPPGLQDFSGALSDLIKDTTKRFKDPSLDSSIALDNHIQMQYEIIAKQLTLLRDEIGPDERLVFLELPTSIYTVPSKDNDYVVQVEWEVKNYIAARPTPTPDAPRMPTQVWRGTDTPRTDRDEREDEQPPAPAPSATPQRSADELNREGPVTLSSLMEYKRARLKMNDNRDARVEALRIKSLPREQQDSELEEDAKQRNDTLKKKAEELERKFGGKVKIELVSVNPEDPESQFRTLDLIPRQSDLNVNDAVGSSKNWNFAGALSFLFGFGARIGFQRQRDKFEQFMQQDVFASAHGKGLSHFGWTFGPHPGTTRLNPGLRTTYAVLIVPRDALAVEFAAKAKVFNRKKSPDDPDDNDDVNVFPKNGSQSFTLLIPQEATARFKVNGIAYTPAPKGGNVTALLIGQYFSPQIGVFVNGTPLARAISITKNESDAINGIRTTSGVQGEFEYLSSENIVMNFSMGPEYTGTPLITLVTPEKTSAINYFNLDLNFRGDPARPEITLIKDGDKFPMFLEPFDVLKMDAPKEDPADATKYVTTLHGNGFVKEAKVSINGNNTDVTATYDTVRTYLLKFPKALIDGKTESKVSLSQHSIQGIQQKTIVFDQVIPGEFEVTDIQPGKGPVKAETIIRLTLPAGADPNLVNAVPGSGVKVGNPLDEGGGKYRFTFSALEDPLLLNVPKADGTLKLLKVPLPLVPTITAIKNSNTGSATAPAQTDGLQATIEGRNFTHVNGVFFGSAPAEIISIDPRGTTIYVNIPKGAQGKVKVLLKTDLAFRARPLTNASDFGALGRANFTYTEPPKGGQQGDALDVELNLKAKRGAGRPDRQN